MFHPLPTPFSAFFSPSYGDLPDFTFAAAPPTLLTPAVSPVDFAQAVYPPAYAPLAATAAPRFAKMDLDLAMSHDLDAQEAAARNYRPEFKGALVGDKKSSRSITEEYAKADPVYVAKTMALPDKYSHYRPIMGDGNCGWRALGFSYFETLAKQANKPRIEGEVARLMSLSNLVCSASGHGEWMFEDYREEVLALLKDLAAAVKLGTAQVEPLILDRFNDDEKSNGIVYYFRLVASAWLRANATMYQGFITDSCGVDGYCRNSLEVPNTEIDHLGMTLLIDILMKPIGVSVEIVYLDRSEGSQVNAHLIEAPETSGHLGPIAYLLYRPGHYDILYKDLPPPMTLGHAMASSLPVDLQINRVSSFTEPQPMASNMSHVRQFSAHDYAAMASIPGMSLFGPPPPNPAEFPAFTAVDAFPMSFNMVASKPSAPLSPISPVTPVSPLSPDASVSPVASVSSYPPTTLPLHGGPPPAPCSPVTAPTTLNALPTQSHFRPSKYEYEAEWADSPQPTFQTSTFKNSHYNIAHYNNPNFQPEEWSPDHDDTVGRRFK